MAKASTVCVGAAGVGAVGVVVVETVLVVDVVRIVSTTTFTMEVLVGPAMLVFTVGVTPL